MRAAWLEVDLQAYRRNLRRLGDHCGVPLLAVVKANAYGHGLVPVARAALQAGAWGVGVALPEEGLELRESGIGGKILILGLHTPCQAPSIVDAGLQSVVSEERSVLALASAARTLGKTAELHLKVDTGMGRVGALPGQVPGLLRSILESPELRLAGVLTHFSSADEADGEATVPQGREFGRVMDVVREAVQSSGRDLPIFHASNSAALLWHPEAACDLARPGLATYGVAPAERDLPFPLEPVISLKARLTQLRWLEPGTTVGYGRTFTTETRSLIGIAPVGYGDGLPWRLSGNGEALVLGKRVKIAGRISMDQTALDLTPTPGAQQDDVATFIGADGGERITVGTIAAAAGTIPYEVLTGLSHRLPRIFTE